MKTCNKCGEIKPLTEFYTYKSGRRIGQMVHPCKRCSNTKSSQFRRENPDRFLESMRKWKEKNRHKTAAASKKWKAANPEKYHEGYLRRSYGITLESYYQMIARQGGGCAICGVNKNITKHGRLAVDHCHKTGAIRGVLCSKCNTAIGALNDDISLITRAAAYMMSHESGKNVIQPIITSNQK